MIGPASFMDEIDCGGFFGHVDDLLDFPSEDIEFGLSAPDSSNNNLNNKSFPSIWSTQSKFPPASDSMFSDNSASDLSAELSSPYGDIVHLEWLSNLVEDSFSGGNAMKKQESSCININNHQQYQTSTPILVLESSIPKVAASDKRGRARSKRPRPATFTPRLPLQLQLQPPNVPFHSHNYAHSRLVIKIPKQVATEYKKKKRIKLSPPLPHVEANLNSSPQQAIRKCMHCEVTKTPQWRVGPMGPKTLCNACGVRFKSGRLFPEYRPAASPTFSPSLHSNSHKKVLEMQSKTNDEIPMPGTATVELIPNNTNLAME
ncbi:hypothetical protein K2173_020517 [Erythroxylum novogranatense]|uniref:GATA transcription factor n=1 Tax=Erythroxylum novogranatense TaxID=1862640 RepID=A0AAV8TGL0_9ROSI|nr:hypothetical protein K2173_020517 [Erythroxylum novogranatense]